MSCATTVVWSRSAIPCPMYVLPRRQTECNSMSSHSPRTHIGHARKKIAISSFAALSSLATVPPRTLSANVRMAQERDIPCNRAGNGTVFQKKVSRRFHFHVDPKGYENPIVDFMKKKNRHASHAAALVETTRRATTVIMRTTRCRLGSRTKRQQLPSSTLDRRFDCTDPRLTVITATL